MLVMKAPSNADRDMARGLLDCHFGRIFTHNEVFSTKLRYRIGTQRKRFWWRIKRPFQLIAHRNCPYCKKMLGIINDESTG